MAEAIDIRELNERIERQSAFVTNLMEGMNQVIVGQKHLIESLLIGLLSETYSAGRCSGIGKDFGNQNPCFIDRFKIQSCAVYS